MDRLKALLEFLEEDPKDSFTRFALAREYLKLGRTDEALRFFEDLVEEDPAYVGTYYHLGKLYETLGRRDDALETYRSGIETARHARDFHGLSELQDALLKAEGVGFDD